MYEPISASSLVAILALAAQIELDPRFKVRDIYTQPKPFVEVKDRINGLIVGFSSEADFETYCQIILRKGA